MLELYHWEPNAESLALLITLKEKKVDFKSHYVDMLKLEQHDAKYLAKSPNGTVPLLVDDGEAMADCGFALQYLAEKYPDRRLAPPDPSGWYDVQAWASWLAMALSANVRLLGWNAVMLKQMPPAELAALREGIGKLPKRPVQAGRAQVTSDAEASENQLANAREHIQGVLDRMEATLKGQAWLAGSDYSITDIQAFAGTHTLPRLEPKMVSEERTPKIMKWLGVVANRPTVKEALAMRTSKIAPEVYAPPGT